MTWMSSIAVGKIIISDTSCLIGLERLGKLELLHDLYGEVFITPVVEREYRQPLPDWVITVPVRNLEKQHEFALIVDEGEASAIALAFEIRNCTLILDDGKGRRLAAKLGLTVQGTLGVGLEAKKVGLLESVSSFIRQLRQVGFRISPELEQDTLRQADEL